MQRLNDEEKEVLRQAYQKLKNNMVREKVYLHDQSLLVGLSKTTSNRVSTILIESSIDVSDYSRSVVAAMIEKNLLIAISSPDNDRRIRLTANGLWNYEKELLGYSERKLINYFEQELLSKARTSDNVTDAEKIILCSMIATRCFSIDSCLDLTPPENEHAWTDIFRLVSQFLVSLQVIKSVHSFKESKSGEYPVSYMMRRANQLPKKSTHIYKFAEGKKYFLDISLNSTIDKNKLMHVMRMVFNQIVNKEQGDQIKTFLFDIAYQKSRYVRKDERFNSAPVDSLLRDALMDMYYDSA
jgi:hypothetical protein